MADQGSEGLLSPWLRRKRIEAALPHLAGRVLDVGCGSGALAAHVAADRYCGVDIDAESLALARRRYPDHEFREALPASGDDFDTIVSLAVIEHVPDPARFLTELKARLGAATGSRIVISTPRPAVDWIHTAGSAVGLFSGHASEEHEELLDRPDLERAATDSGLELESFRRFLFGANQLAVFRRHGETGAGSGPGNGD
jgi:2-polyprenyl-3-methyl-5-hydroxy-6-metoxy-1,4-benzoquinol methylase